MPVDYRFGRSSGPTCLVVSGSGHNKYFRHLPGHHVEGDRSRVAQPPREIFSSIVNLTFAAEPSRATTLPRARHTLPRLPRHPHLSRSVHLGGGVAEYPNGFGPDRLKKSDRVPVN